jgi:hypothetical protein
MWYLVHGLPYLSGTCDAQYHVMWVILHSALEEFHLQEARSGEMDEAVVQALVRQVAEEALVGALRIAGLVCRYDALPFNSDQILPKDKRPDLQRISTSRPEHPAFQYICSWNVPRTAWETRSQNLHKRPRTVLVCIRGGL